MIDRLRRMAKGDLALLAQMVALCIGTAALAQGERACVTVARCAQAPVIDGAVGPDEWRDAATLRGFVELGGGALAQPPTAVSVTFDERAIYVAAACEESDPTRPRGFAREHDDRAFEDDCIRVYIAPEDLRSAEEASVAFGGYDGAYNTWFQDIAAYYEFTVNCHGSATEARNDVRDWDAPWEAEVGRTDLGWIVEMAIPFASLGLEMPAESVLWGFNVFRARPPELSGWVCPNFGGYRPTPLGAIHLVDAVPVVKQVAVQSPRLGSNELAFEVWNPTSESRNVKVWAEGSGAEATLRQASLAPDERATVTVPYELSGRGRLGGRYRVGVAGEEIPLLAGVVPLTVPVGMRVDLRYYSIPGRVEGRVTLDEGTVADTAVLKLRSAQGAVVTEEARIAGSRGTILRLPVTGEVGAEFEATLSVMGADGEPMQERAISFAIREHPRWINTQAGLPLGVLPPWTPMQVRGRAVEMLGKRLSFRDLALPASISSAGEKLLSAPMTVSVTTTDGPVVWQSRKCDILERADDHVVVESLWRGRELDLGVTSRIEYDGFCWNELTLTPHEAASVEHVSLDIPLRKEVCKYAYRGDVNDPPQRAHALPPHGLRQPITPSLWIGDESRGLAWMTESLEWVEAEDRARQVEIVPRGDDWLWRSTFIDTPTELTEPYEAKFALHVTPTKPVSKRKNRIYHGAYYAMEDAQVAGRLAIPARGNIDLEQGTFECWLKPTFDPSESHDEPISTYIRQFLILTTSAQELLILYYNPEERSMRLVTKMADGTYPVVLSGPQKMPTDEWCYVGLSWGDELRLSINGEVATHPLVGTVSGSVSGSTVGLDLSHFHLDDLRISKVQRSLDGVPSGELPDDADTLFLSRCETLTGADTQADSDEPTAASDCVLVDGRFGEAIGPSEASFMDRLARDGKRIVIFHETWSRFQGVPDLEQIPKLKRIADACHERGMLFLVYFGQLMSDASPEWLGRENDFMALPDRMWYHRDDVVQDCYVSCVNGIYGDLLLDGIAKLADEAGIDGIYMDGTTVPWDCWNPTHEGCGEDQGDGTYRSHVSLRATREFMKRLRSIFAERREEFFLDAHTGGAINIATQSFCDGYWDGEQLARYKPGFRLSPDAFITGYMGRQLGFRGELLPNRHTMDEALAISLVHDSATRGQPAAVDLAWAEYEDDQTRFIPYWELSDLYSVIPGEVLCSLYLKRDRALLVLGSQTEENVRCEMDIAGLLAKLPGGAEARDAITGEPLSLSRGELRFRLPGRQWQMIELKRTD